MGRQGRAGSTELALGTGGSWGDDSVPALPLADPHCMPASKRGEKQVWLN